MGNSDFEQTFFYFVYLLVKQKFFTVLDKSPPGQSKSKIKKNTLTGPANGKKTCRYHAHLSLCAKSRKTNDEKSKKWLKTTIWAIF